MLLNIVAGCFFLMPLGTTSAATARLADLVAGELETYFVLDGRETLSGRIVARPSAASKKALLSAGRGRLEVQLVPLLAAAKSVEPAFALTAEQLGKDVPITIPLGRLPGGYYRLHGRLTGEDGRLVAEGEVTDSHGLTLLLCVRKLRPSASVARRTTPGDYLLFVRRCVGRSVQGAEDRSESMPGFFTKETRLSRS